MSNKDFPEQNKINEQMVATGMEGFRKGSMRRNQFCFRSQIGFDWGWRDAKVRGKQYSGTSSSRLGVGRSA